MSNNSNLYYFNWNKKKDNLLLPRKNNKTNIIIFHHGPDNNDESISSFWNEIETSAKKFGVNNEINIDFKGFDNSPAKQILYLEKFRDEKKYLCYDAIISTVIDSKYYLHYFNNDLNKVLFVTPDDLPKEFQTADNKNLFVKDHFTKLSEEGNITKNHKDMLIHIAETATVSSVNDILNNIGKSVPLITFNTVDKKVPSEIKYIGNGEIGEKISGIKLAVMTLKFAIESISVYPYKALARENKFNSRDMENEAFSQNTLLSDNTNSTKDDNSDNDENMPTDFTILNMKSFNPELSIEDLDNVDNKSEIFNFFKNIASKLFDRVLVYISENNNYALKKRLEGLKYIFNIHEDDIIINNNNTANALDLLEKKINSKNERYAIFLTQSTNINDIIEIIDYNKELGYNIICSGVCDLTEDIVLDINESFISAGSGMHPKDEITNVLNYIEEYLKNNKNVNNLIQKSKTINNDDNSNANSMSIESIKESLNPNVIYYLPSQQLTNIYFRNVFDGGLDNFDEDIVDGGAVINLMNYLLMRNVFKDNKETNNLINLDLDNSAEAYTIYIPNPFYDDNDNKSNIVNLINNIIRGFMDVLECVDNFGDYHNDKTPEEQDVYIDALLENIEGEKSGYHNYFDIQYTVHNAEKFGYQLSFEAEEQLLSNNGNLMYEGNTFTFFDIYETGSFNANPNQDNDDDAKIKYFSNNVLVNDALDVIFDYCRLIATIKHGNSLGESKVIDFEDRVYGDNNTRHRRHRHRKRHIDFAKIERERRRRQLRRMQILRRRASEVARRKEEQERQKAEREEDAARRRAEAARRSAEDARRMAQEAATEAEEQAKKIAEEAEEEAKKKEEYLANKAKKAAEIATNKINEKAKKIQDLMIKYNFDFCKLGLDSVIDVWNEMIDLLDSEDSKRAGACIIFGLSGEIKFDNNVDIATKAGLQTSNINFNKDIKCNNKNFRDSQMPPRQIYGLLSEFFNLGFTRIEFKANNVTEIITVTTEITSTGDFIPAKANVGYILNEGYSFDLYFNFKLGKNNKNKNLSINYSKEKAKKIGAPQIIIGSDGEIRLALDTNVIKGKETVDLDVSNIVNMFDFSKEEKKNIKSVIDEFEPSVKFDIEYHLSLEPFVSLEVTSSTIYCGVLVQPSQFKVSNVDITFPTALKGLVEKSPYPNQFKKCVGELLGNSLNIKLPCFEVNTE